MQKSLWIKAAVVFGLMFALLVPLGMIEGLVGERAGRQAAVVEDIAASSAGPQRLFGPVLVVPYSEHWQEAVDYQQNGKTKKRLEERVETHELRFLPEQLNINGNLSPETKHRGLFKVRSYVLDAEFKGRFSIPPGIGKPRPEHKGRIVFGTPRVGVAVSDMRGVLAAPRMDWNGKLHGFEQGSGLYFSQTSGMHVNLDALAETEAATDVVFGFTLKLRGLENLDITPAGSQTHVALVSAWPHPGFHGRFLPDPQTQEISPDGFRATWSVNALASNVADSLRQCKELNCFDSFGVRLVDPINIYSLSDRATKYGFLFVCLTFAATFLFEVLKRLAIHPAQYTLVGLALAMFFLLLLSLSEHIGFGLAYVCASSSCVSLIVYYLSGVLGGLRRAASAGLMLGGLFGALYGLLQSEDNSLVLGSVLLFALLALAMAATRRVDWYRLGKMPAECPAEFPG